MNTISIDDFSKIEMKIGKVLEASNIIESSKLLLLKVDFGNNDIRSVVSGIAKYYSPENLINKKFIFVTNLEPRTILQYQSQAMIIASHNIDNTEISLLIPEKDDLTKSTWEEILIALQSRNLCCAGDISCGVSNDEFDIILGKLSSVDVSTNDTSYCGGTITYQITQTNNVTVTGSGAVFDITGLSLGTYSFKYNSL